MASPGNKSPLEMASSKYKRIWSLTFMGGFLGQTLIFCHIAMHADMGYKYIYG